MKYYSFDYYGWIPNRRDFEQGWYMCKAESEKQAWDRFWERQTDNRVEGVTIREIKSTKNETAN